MAIPLPVVRRLARDNYQMGTRLAQFEFREMQAELDNPALFDLKIDFPDQSDSFAPDLTTLALPPMSRRLPILRVSLGKTAWAEDPEALPSLGMYVPDLPGDHLRAGLRGFFVAHHARPFCRPVFICETMRPVPFLGRYGFVCEYLGRHRLEIFTERIHQRFGINQLRALTTGELLWREPSKP
jgi:hypothetical protein